MLNFCALFLWLAQPHLPHSIRTPPSPLLTRSNAYMLVYVREADWDRILCPVGAEDIAEHVRRRLEQEQADKEARQKEKAEAHLYVTLKVCPRLCVSVF